MDEFSEGTLDDVWGISDVSVVDDSCDDVQVDIDVVDEAAAFEEDVYDDVEPVSDDSVSDWSDDVMESEGGDVAFDAYDDVPMDDFADSVDSGGSDTSDFDDLDLTDNPADSVPDMIDIASGQDDISGVDTSEVERYDLSPEVRNLEVSENSERFRNEMDRLSAERSDLVRTQRELESSGGDPERLAEVDSRLRQTEYDLERLHGAGAPAPNRDFVYKDMDDLQPGSPSNLRKDESMWDGEVGQSKLRSDSDEVNRILEKYGQDGVEYRNNNPDFRPFTKHYDENLGYFDGEVAIHDMKGNSDSFGNKFDGRGRNLNGTPGEDGLALSDLGNFAQADLALSQKLNTTPADIEKYRKDNGLTWHECNDGVTMQLVPSKINSYFTHQGGTSMVKNQNLDGTVIRDYSALRTKRS